MLPRLPDTKTLFPYSSGKNQDVHASIFALSSESVSYDVEGRADTSLLPLESMTSLEIVCFIVDLVGYL